MSEFRNEFMRMSDQSMKQRRKNGSTIVDWFNSMNLRFQFDLLKFNFRQIKPNQMKSTAIHELITP